MESLHDVLEGRARLRWLYIDFNSYFASVEQQLDPRLRGRPVAVVPVETDATCAIAASYEAKRYGIRTGTPVYEAKRLCPGLICVLAQHEKYVEYHHRIREEVGRHIPVDVVASIDEVGSRLMDNETDPAFVRGLAARIKAGLAAHVGPYLTCSIGAAPNRYLAKIAADMQKPDGLTLLEAQDLPRRLLELKLTDLPGIGRNMEKRLLMQGIGTMQQLMALPAQRLRALWGGVEGERLWYKLRGAELAERETERRSIGHSHVLAPELRPPQQARYVAVRLMFKAASRLRRMGYVAREAGLSLRLADGRRLEAGMACTPTRDTPMFLHMLAAMWDRLGAEKTEHHVRKVSVLLQRLAPEQAPQELLFSAAGRAEEQKYKSERLSDALDRVNQRFGRDSLLIGMLPSQGRGFSGTKVAFTRIPDEEEFAE